MWKHRCSIVAVALCLGCASTKGAAPDEESPAPESETTEETPPASEETAGSEEKPAESETPPASDDKPKGEKSEEKSGSSKKGCDGLAKDKCKITSGCAWNDLNKGKCVEEGASE